MNPSVVEDRLKDVKVSLNCMSHLTFLKGWRGARIKRQVGSTQDTALYSLNVPFIMPLYQSVKGQLKYFSTWTLFFVPVSKWVAGTEVCEKGNNVILMDYCTLHFCPFCFCYWPIQIIINVWQHYGNYRKYALQRIFSVSRIAVVFVVYGG